MAGRAFKLRGKLFEDGARRRAAENLDLGTPRGTAVQRQGHCDSDCGGCGSCLCSPKTIPHVCVPKSGGDCWRAPPAGWESTLEVSIARHPEHGAPQGKLISVPM